MQSTTNRTQLEEQLSELLWDYLKRDPEHRDRRQTSFGTKTKQGLAASILRIVEECGTQAPVAREVEAK